MTTTAVRRPHRLRALTTAEARQFRRNKTLLYMGTVFPIALPLFTFFVGRNESGTSASLVAVTFEIFALTALLFVQYYSVLSMVTTRRGEGVLKRLRTGEARDWEIKTAPAVPGAVLTVLGAAVVAAAVYLGGAPGPVNIPLLAIAVGLGIIIFTLLALATSAMTKNAEAAQITSLPVMAIAVLGMSSIRTVLPERWERIADFTPFAAISDLTALGSVGRLFSTPKSEGAMTMAETFSAAATPLVTLGVWAALAYYLATRYFTWDDRG
ncbi:ABC transporter permease [Demetria terragena]|uniref:ABC transporter permease n=1 Tax=Demetria terragena TaxID=63959 RepID=UPI000375F100|nr:ABC transporter permease [Demetria terragena]